MTIEQYIDENKNGTGKKGRRDVKGNEHGPFVVVVDESGGVLGSTETPAAVTLYDSDSNPMGTAPETSTTIDNATFSQTVTGEDIDFTGHQHAILTVKTGTATTSPTLSVALQVKDSNGNYITHTTLTTISTATTAIEEFYFLSAQTVRVVCTFGGSGNFATTTVELQMK